MRKLFKAAIIVTIFSVATRALGFLLRIILSRALGAEILGSYQVAMSIFGVLSTLVASGLPLVVSRSVAYKKSIGKDNEAYSTVTAGLIITLIISTLVSLIILLFPQVLDLIFMHGETTSIVLYTLPGLIASAVYCVLRSSLWGDKHFFAISFTEFFEQVVRIIFCFILFSSFATGALSLGKKAALSLSIACIFSSVLVLIVYLCLKNKFANPKRSFKPLLKSSTPITALRTCSSLVQSLIALIIPIRLTLYGYTSSEAMAQFGMIMGMAFPLIMIPGTLISSLAVTLVPELSSKTENIDDKSHTKDLSGLKKHIQLGINMSILISAVFVPGFMALGRPICEILFNSSEAGKYVSYAAIIMIPMGINQITGSILNSIGLELKSLINYAISATALLLCIFFLPKYLGTNALIVGMGLMSIISSLLNIRMLKNRNLLDSSHIKNLCLSYLFALLSSIFGMLLYSLLSKLMHIFITTLITGILVEGIMVFLCYIFNLSGIKAFIYFKNVRKRRKN